jgi:tetratricopeptide (TPR) repeat protein
MTRKTIASVCLLAALLSGCATLRQMNSPEEDVDVQAQKRRQETVKAFESQRDYAQMEAALSRWKSGDVKGCREGLEKLLARNPQHHEAQLLLADLMLSEQQPEAAVAQLKQTLTDDPSNARAQHTMGLVLEASGKTDEALVYFQRAAELEPKNELYALSYKTAQDASRLEAQGPANAIEPAGSADWDEAIANASIMQTLESAGSALADGDLAAARAGFMQAAAADPENLQIPLHAAIFSLRHEHPEIAVELLTPASQRFPDSAALYRVLGTADYRLGDFRAAQLALQEAVSLDNSNALAYFLLGCTLKKLGQPEAAERHYEQAQNLNPSFAVPR